MQDSQYYGGSAEEARDGQRSFRLFQEAIEHGFTIRHEKGKIVIVLAPTRTKEQDDQ